MEPAQASETRSGYWRGAGESAGARRACPARVSSTLVSMGTGAREETPWGQKRHTDNRTEQKGPGKVPGSGILFLNWSSEFMLIISQLHMGSVSDFLGLLFSKRLRRAACLLDSWPLCSHLTGGEVRVQDCTDLPYLRGKPGGESGKFSREEFIKVFHRFMGFVAFFFFSFELQDCEVPDAPCKTMPHRGEPGRGSVRSSLRPP